MIPARFRAMHGDKWVVAICSSSSSIGVRVRSAAYCIRVRCTGIFLHRKVRNIRCSGIQELVGGALSSDMRTILLVVTEGFLGPGSIGCGRWNSLKAATVGKWLWGCAIKRGCWWTHVSIFAAALLWGLLCHRRGAAAGVNKGNFSRRGRAAAARGAGEARRGCVIVRVVIDCSRCG